MQNYRALVICYAYVAVETDCERNLYALKCDLNKVCTKGWFRGFPDNLEDMDLIY